MKAIMRLVKRVDVLLLILSVALGLMVFRFFPGDKIETFGYTPLFLNIARTSIEEGKYMRSLSPSFDSSKSIVISEVQREPFYPLMLISSNQLFGNFFSLVYVQLILFVIFMYMLGVFVRKEFGLNVSLGLYLMVWMSPVIKLYVSVLYPYTFQLIFLGLGIMLLTKSLERNKLPGYCTSGLLFGLAMYERGSYLFLPIFIFLVLLVLSLLKKIRVSRAGLVCFLIAPYLLCMPFLVRNISYGVFGISQVTGYTLGYSYGAFPLSRNPNQDEIEYKTYVSSSGTDTGTQYFIFNNTFIGNGTFVENDKKVSTIAVAEIKNNIGGFISAVRKNVLLFPGRLINPVGVIKEVAVSDNPLEYYMTFASSVYAVSFIELLVFVTAIAGLCTDVLKLKFFAIISSAVIFYSLSTVCLTVLFDPRYRGIVDLLLFIYSSSYIFGLLNKKKVNIAKK